MAMGKNKTGIMAAISAATEVAASQTEPRDRAQRTLPRGTIGSVRAGLGGIQEIDPALILAWRGDTTHPVTTAEILHAGLPQSDLHVADDDDDLHEWPGLTAEFMAQFK